MEVSFPFIDDEGRSEVQKDYVYDPQKTDVLIRFSFFSPIVFKDFGFDDGIFHLTQHPSGIVNCAIEKKISQRLFEDIKNRAQNKDKKDVVIYVLGYIHNFLAKINKRILERKYLEGRILSRTISIYDLLNISVIDKANQGAEIYWPMPIKGTLPYQSLTEEQDAIFIRDLIDAITSYFYFNYDDCIRKIVTSIENYFIHFNLKTTWSSRFLGKIFPRIGLKFYGQITKYISKDFCEDPLYKEEYLKILQKNIVFLYKIRNQIVHDKLRLGLDSRVVVIKAIHTLLHIYLSSPRCKERVRYFVSLKTQFQYLDHPTFSPDLDELERLAESDSVEVIKDREKPQDIWCHIRLITKYVAIACDIPSEVYERAVMKDLEIKKSERKKVGKNSP